MTDSPKDFNPLMMPLAGSHSISASAGTGKTYAITTLYLRYLLEADCCIEQILVTTFTEAATAELRDRLRIRLHQGLLLLRRCSSSDEAHGLATEDGVDDDLVLLLDQAGAWQGNAGDDIRKRLEDALLCFDRAPIFTIHGFCHRTLQELIFETNSSFDMELTTSQQLLVERAVGDFVANKWASSDSELAKWTPLDETFWKTMVDVAASVANNPKYAVAPEASSDQFATLLSSPLLKDFDKEIGQLQIAWCNDRDKIIAMLLTARENGWLNGNTHGQSGQLEGSIEFIEAIVAAPSIDQFTVKKNALPPVQRRLAQNALIKGTKKAHKDNAPKHKAFACIERIVAKVAEIAGLCQEIRIQLLALLADDARVRVAAAKSDLAIMSFDDLLHGMDTALEGPHRDRLLGCLRQRYHVALVDEFQDTDSVQSRIFRRVFHEAVTDDDSSDVLRAFVMIGDPKQSIYRFRGADVHSYLAASADAPEDHHYTMGTNWRSDAPLVEAVNAVFSSTENPFLQNEIPFYPVEAKHEQRFKCSAAFEIVMAPRHYRAEGGRAQKKSLALSQAVCAAAEDIVSQLQDGIEITTDGGTRHIGPQDIAVLCRAGKHLRAIQEALAERGVPAVIQAGESVFITAEAHAVRFVLHGLLNPDNQGAVFAALQTPIFGLCAGELEEVRTEEAKFSRWVRKFGDWGEMLQRDGFLVTWRRILDAQASLSRLAGQVLGERQIANYLHIGELLHNWALEAHAGPIELLGWLERSMAEADGDAEENQIRLESDAEAVQLCTIHASKGLEYPIVYCPTLWDVYGSPGGAFVIARHDKERKLLDVSEIDVGSEQFVERLNMDKEQSREEDRRNLYVALTRAVHQCRVYWTSATGSEKSAMGRIMGCQSPELHDGKIEEELHKWVDSLDTEHVQLRVAGNPAVAAAPTSYAPEAKTDTKLSARLIQRKKLSPLDQTSFTALSRTIVAAEDVAMADRDEVSQAVDEDKGGLADPGDGRLIPLADMPGGRKVGVLVHNILEDLLGDTELTGRDGPLVTQAASVLLERHLPRVQLDMGWRDKLAKTLSQCLTGTILDVGEGFRLIDLPHDSLAVEMPFLLRSGRRKHPVKFDQFADAFKHSEDPAVRRYADRARRINRPDLAGFLSGFIDLTFTWGGRWYLLDYKSNNLGPKMTDYAPNSLTRAMAQHDYMLQYHLYAVALHLLLSQRLAGYDYERDFGGAVYMYLRGFDPTGVSRRGVYFNRPDFAVIDALTKALLGEDAV